MNDKVKIQNDISVILDIIARLIFTIEEVYDMSVIFIVRKYIYFQSLKRSVTFKIFYLCS